MTISDNLVVGTGYNGILVMGAKDLSITGNELVSNPGSTNNTWLRVETADGVTARNNRAQLISFVQSLKVVQEGNVQTSPVTDGGLAALRAWAAAHLEMAPSRSAAGHRLGATRPLTGCADMLPRTTSF